MTSKSLATAIAISFLLGDTNAIRFRPIKGSVPWHKEIIDTTWAKPDWPIDYFVPDFGKDTDMINVNKSINGSEKFLKKNMTASWDAKGDGAIGNYAANPREYFVPDFGKDSDIKNVQSAISEAEKSLDTTMTANFGDKKAAVNPRDYFVPNFGIDHEIINVAEAIKVTEKRMGKKFLADFGRTKDSVNPRDYDVPDFGLDHNIKDSQKNEKDAEKKLNVQWKTKQDANGFYENMPEAADNSSYAYSDVQYINNNGLAQVNLLQVDPVENTCTNANKATGLDQDCSAAGNSAWNTISTSRTGDPTQAQAPPYPDHTLH